mmetsp:Transcript_15709/g.24761  ORF Transcript_15709/g.24761 Transcript_15709/m.24761 type:complete len:82 (+) Transcript_15709:17-262(+)
MHAWVFYHSCNDHPETLLCTTTTQDLVLKRTLTIQERRRRNPLQHSLYFQSKDRADEEILTYDDLEEVSLSCIENVIFPTP